MASRPWWSALQENPPRAIFAWNLNASESVGLFYGPQARDNPNSTVALRALNEAAGRSPPPHHTPPPHLLAMHPNFKPVDARGIPLGLDFHTAAILSKRAVHRAIWGEQPTGKPKVVQLDQPCILGVKAKLVLKFRSV